MTNVVINQSEGNKYNYASLSDIAKQGYKIPKMTVRKIDGDEYVCYWDELLVDGETSTGWIQGARVVVPSPILNKDGKPAMNEAQLYGSALTYARRYTVLLALGLACEDDKNLESEPMATDKQVAYITKLYDGENIAKIKDYYRVEQLSDLSLNQAKEVIERAKKRNEKHNQPES